MGKEVKKGDRLTTKQRLFVEYYLGEAKGNATDAARLAGYSGGDNALSQRGHELVRNSKIAVLIQTRVTEAAMPANEVLKELSDIARADWREFVKVHYGREGEVVNATLLLKDKIRALELLGKHHKLWDRAAETPDLVAEARKAVAKFLAENPKAKPEEVLPIYAETFGVSVDQISEAVN